MSLSGKTYVVTGAASGIGAAAAVELRNAGANVIGLDRHAVEGFNGMFIKADLSTSRGVLEAVNEMPDGIDGLLNIAGVPGTAPWELVLGVNALAVRDLSQAVLPKIQQGGVVLNLASGVANFWKENSELVSAFVDTKDWESALSLVRDVPGVTENSYRFSKECVRWITVQEAAENLGRARFVSVSPGPVATPILDDFRRDHGPAKVAHALATVGRAGTPEDIAPVIRFLLSSEAAWINGADLEIDGGLSAYRTLGSVQSQREPAH